MSYLVLARKYRPQTFADLVGQEQVSRTLKNALATGRVAHAYLFSGPRGVGKTTAARLLAMALSCEAENVADRPCGQCPQCLEIQSGRAVDVIEVDGASNRGINEIRDLRETVKYLPAKSRYKVYIIDEVHALTKDAFNALLKTLEEPPSHVVFIFATTETHKVLPTILSRCQRYDFRRIGVEDIALRLKQVVELEGLEADFEALELIAKQADGGLRDSLSLLDQAIASTGARLTAEEVRRTLGLIDQELVRQIVNATLSGEAPEALGALEEAYRRGYDFKDLGVKILEYIRSLTLVKAAPEQTAFMNLADSEEAALKTQAQAHSLETLNRHFDAWLKFQGDLSRSPQPRWLLEAQIIRLSQLAPLLPMGELIERLGRLLAVNPAPPRPAAAAPAAPPLPKPHQTGAAVAQNLKNHSEKPVSPETAPPSYASDDDPGEADDSEGELTGLITSWPTFMRHFGKDLDDVCRASLTGAKADDFGPSLVALTLSASAGLSGVLKKYLEERLRPLLKKVFGHIPDLSFTAKVNPAEDQNLMAEKIEAIKKTPEAQALMSRLPGEFVAFKPDLTQTEGGGQETEVDFEEPEQDNPELEDENFDE